MSKMQWFRFLLPGIIAQSATFLAFADTVVVGKCRSNLQAYSTISQAVSSVPADSTILVCPGVYREQVIITQPLTLNGVQTGGSANPTIAVPSDGLTQSFNRTFFQILVQGTDSGRVKIRYIDLDGSNSRIAPDFGFTGIYYDNSSGTIGYVAIHGQFTSMILQSNTPSAKGITVTHSSLHDFSDWGVGAFANDTPLTVNVISNSITTSNSLSGGNFTGIFASTAGTISDNLVITRPPAGTTSSGHGIIVSSDAHVLGNSVEGFSVGIELPGDSNVARSNKVALSGVGIVIGGDRNIVQHNSIFNGGEGIAFLNCSSRSNTVTHNLINESSIGIINGNSSNTTIPNSFFNVEKTSSPLCGH